MELCKQLSYERSLHPGKAVFYYKTESSEFEPLEIETSRIRGQKSSYTEAFSANGAPKNLQPQDLAFSNPVTLESCYVPPLVNEVCCRFSLRVLANSLEPAICSDSGVRQQLKELAASYKKAGGYAELAKRYSRNILSGRWLWRNQQSPRIDVEVVTSNDNTYKVTNGHLFDWHANWKGEEKKALDGLTKELEVALTDPRRYFFADITATIKTAFCQEIHPSQLFTERSDDREQGIATRQYAKVKTTDGREAASLGAEKVGAALQMIDDFWQEGAADYPLRVHAYGADNRNVIALRSPETEQDFYTLLQRADEFTEDLNGSNDACRHAHFLMSNLIKGGLFQKGKT